MTDVLTPEQRSRNMSAIRAKDTKPELAVRSLVHRMGFRYRLHRRELPGTPDLVFPSSRKVIFVHGCFWHRHRCRAGQVICATNAEFWRNKFEANVRRDRTHVRQLRALGWESLVVWECSLRNPSELQVRLRDFLQSDSALSGRRA